MSRPRRRAQQTDAVADARAHAEALALAHGHTRKSHGQPGLRADAETDAPADAGAFIKAHAQSYDDTLRGLLLLELDRRRLRRLRRAGIANGLVLLFSR